MANDLNNLLLRLNVDRNLQPQDLCGWMPFKIQFRPEGPLVVWVNLQGRPLAEACFFKPLMETYIANRRSQDDLILTPIDILIHLQEYASSLKPSGFIFHSSRCGSTLLANMLAALPGNQVLIEPNVINKVLLAPVHQFSQSVTRCWLRAVIQALGQPIQEIAENYFIKFSSWNILHLPLIKICFPETPCLIIYRDPVEVMVSQLHEPGGWMRAKRRPKLVAPRVQLTAQEIETLSIEAYCARVLGNFYAAAGRAVDDSTRVINYDQLSEPLLRQMMAFVGLIVSDGDITLMTNRMKYYAKDPQQRQTFADDRARKQRLATPAIRQLADRWVIDHYNLLQGLNSRQSFGLL